MTLKAPFPYFGGKSRAACIIWDAFGVAPNYVEPFAGSLAVLLGRPSPPKTETVNDLDCFLSNFWRAIKNDPAAVASWADWPVNECDLEARHLWLVNREDFRVRMKADPDFYDAKVAGWWAWGLCSWIGSGWCAGKSSWGAAFADGKLAHPRLPEMSARGIHTLGNAGHGINRQLPHLGDAGKGINRQLPHLGDAGQGINRKRDAIGEYFQALADRLRNVRVACGDWSRVLTPSVTERHGITGVFLDPPYPSKDRAETYTEDCREVAHDVAAWARDNGDNPLLRIALCGYEGEHEMPASWECVAWKAAGGYSSQKKKGDNGNKYRERIWFSPHCLTGQRQQRLAL